MEHTDIYLPTPACEPSFEPYSGDDWCAFGGGGGGGTCERAATASSVPECVECVYNFEEVFDQIEFPTKPRRSISGDGRCSYNSAEPLSDLDSAAGVSYLNNGPRFDDCLSSTGLMGSFVSQGPKEQSNPLEFDGCSESTKRRKGSCESKGGARKARSSFSKQQLYKLELAFREFIFLDSLRRYEIAMETDLSEKQVKIWFQNRRTKWKPNHKEEYKIQKQRLKRLSRSDRRLKTVPTQEKVDLNKPPFL